MVPMKLLVRVSSPSPGLARPKSVTFTCPSLSSSTFSCAAAAAVLSELWCTREPTHSKSIHVCLKQSIERGEHHSQDGMHQQQLHSRPDTKSSCL